MKKVKNAPTNKDQAAPVERREKPDHRASIKAQVLAKIGTPSRLRRVEVCRQHNGNYRVNIWEQPEPKADIAATPGSRIGPSYYLKVSDAGEIIDSNPPLAKLGSPN